MRTGVSRQQRGRTTSGRLGRAVTATLLVVLATVGIVSVTASPSGAAGPGCAFVPIHSGVSCSAEEGAAATVVGSGTILLNTVPGAVTLDAEATPGGVCTTACLAPGVLCLGTAAFTAPVTAAQCSGPDRVDVPEARLGGADGQVGNVGFTIPAAFVTAANGTIHIQFGLIGSPCTGTACSAVGGTAYVGWQCGAPLLGPVAGCSGFFGEVALPVPPQVEAPPGTIGVVLLAGGTGLMLAGWQIGARRARRFTGVA